MHAVWAAQVRGIISWGCAEKERQEFSLSSVSVRPPSTVVCEEQGQGRPWHTTTACAKSLLAMQGAERAIGIWGVSQQYRRPERQVQDVCTRGREAYLESEEDRIVQTLSSSMAQIQNVFRRRGEDAGKSKALLRHLLGEFLRFGAREATYRSLPPNDEGSSHVVWAV